MKINDKPQWRKEDDELDRVEVAESMAREIARFDSSDGCVVAVTGPWGSGKTTLIKFMEPTLQANGRGLVVWFNPWYFSGTADLIPRFFKEISAVLGNEPKFQDIAEGAERLGAALAPAQTALALFAQPLAFIPMLLRLPKAIRKAREGGLEEQRKTLSRALVAAEMRFYIVIDDLDRLAPDEIRDMLKLVRLIGDFPRVTYILAFDSTKVIEALSAGNNGGREYLEKIVFATYEVPRVNDSHIRQAIERGINDSLAESKSSFIIDQDRAYDLMQKLFLKEIRTLRGVKRFIASSHFSLMSLIRDIDPLDILGLEAIRLFKQDLFHFVISHFELLSWSEEDLGFGATERKQKAKALISGLLDTDKSDETKWVLKFLFPIAWKAYDDQFQTSQNLAELSRDRRVAHRDFMRLYSERFEDRSILARRKVEEIISLLPSRYESFIAQVPLDQLADIADILAEMTDHLADAAAVPLSAALLNRAAEDRVPRNRIADSGVDRPARRIVSRLLAKADEADRATMVNQLYQAVRGLQNRYRVIEAADQVDEDGVPLLDAAEVASLLQQYLADLADSDSHTLATEKWLFFLVRDVMEKTGASWEELPDFLSDADVAWALLRSAMNPSGFDRSGTVLYSPDLSGLDSVLGSRDRTNELVALCRSTARTDDDKQYLSTVDRALNRATL